MTQHVHVHYSVLVHHLWQPSEFIKPSFHTIKPAEVLCFIYGIMLFCLQLVVHIYGSCNMFTELFLLMYSIHFFIYTPLRLT